MKKIGFEKFIKTASIVIAALWYAALIASVIVFFASGALKGANFNRITATAEGFVGSELLAVSLFAFFGGANRGGLEKAVLITAMIDNILLYADVLTLAAAGGGVRRAIFYLVWFLCTAVCAVMLAVLKRRDRALCEKVEITANNDHTGAKIAVKALSVAHAVFWFAAIVAGIVTVIAYTPAEGEEAFGIYMEYAFYAMMLFGTAIGFVGAGLLALSVFAFFVDGGGAGKSAIICAAVGNLLFYICACALIFMSRSTVGAVIAIVAFLGWCVCSALCIVRLVSLKRRGRPEKAVREEIQNEQ